MTGRRAVWKSERGIVFIGLLVGLFVLAVLLMAAVEPASALARREREQELLFRGGEYTEAIRRYRKENGGGFPTKLKDLLKQGGPKRMRYIRRLYKNPFDRKGKWGLLAPGSTIVKTGKDGKTTYTPVGAPGSRGGGLIPHGSPGKGSKKGTGVKVLPFRLDGKEGQPILGVYCKLHEKGFTTFMEKDFYDEWYFSPLTIKAPRGPMKPGASQRPGPSGQPGQHGQPRAVREGGVKP